MSGWRERAKPVEAPVEGGWRSRAKPVAEEGTPLAKALGEQQGDVVTVETPTGPAQFTREGAPFYSPEEAAKMQAGGGARLKERTLEAALSFLSGGGPLVDELAGAKGMVTDRRQGEGLLDTYRRTRDRARADVAGATRNASPTMGVMGHQVPVLPLAGAVSTSLLAPNPATVLGRIGASGAIGAEQALGESEADFSRGDVGGLLADTGKGLGMGLLAGGGAEGLAVPMRAIARGAASRIGDAVATRATKDAADVAGEVASLQGQARQATQVGSRYSENTLRAANAGVLPMGQSTLGPATQGRAISMLADQDFKALMESVANNTMDEVPDQVRKITAAKQAAAAAAASAPADAAKRTSDFFAKPTITTDVLPRVGRQLQNAATSTAAAIPAAIGAGIGYGKMGAGAMLLAGASHGLGKGALSAARTTLANPRLQVGALEGLIQSAQAGQSAMRAGARSTAATAPLLEDAPPSQEPKDDEAAINAFLAGG